MSKNWICDNRDKAELNTLQRLMGYLAQARDNGDRTVSITEIMQYIEREANRDEERLNRKYPERAR